MMGLTTHYTNACKITSFVRGNEGRRLCRVGRLRSAGGSCAQKVFMGKSRILLADDHRIIREGLRTMLGSQPDMVVVGEADNGNQAVQLAAKLMPDVVVMDVAMPVLNGLEATRQIVGRDPATKVVILSSYNNEEYLRGSISAGALGYILKQGDILELVTAIREIVKGNAFYSPEVSRSLLDHYRQLHAVSGPAARACGPLNPRETDVLRQIAQGRANKEIAAAMNLSVKAVERLRQQLMNKLDLHDVAGLTRYAVARGIIDGPFGGNSRPRT